MNSKWMLASVWVSLVLGLAACNGEGGGSAETVSAWSSGSGAITPGGVPRSYSTDALLFTGAGTWSAEVASLESIMDEHGMSFQAVSSAQLDAMSVDEIAKFGMIVWPGGSGGTQTGSLSADTHARLREAVQKRGVSYIGFCAGSFVAVAPAPAAAGQDVSYGLGILAGPELNYYYLEDQGIDFQMVKASFADGRSRDLVWYGGPVTPDLPGGVVARYPNGQPMITQAASGQGFVMLSAVHPAAPQSVRDSFGVTDSDGLDLDLAYELLDDTLHVRPLKTF